MTPAAMPGICGVCNRVAASYTCPRCQLGYCSLGCYKGHSEKCTESFYQAQVEEALHSQRATGAERKWLEGMVAQLNNLGEEDEEDPEEDEEDREERRLLALVERAEHGELSIDDLTEEEVQCFHSELKRGALGQALGAWEPWWQRAAVHEMDLNSLDDDPPEPSAASLPRGPLAPSTPPAHLCCTGAGQKVNPAVALTALEVLYAYVHTMRAYNGDCAWDPAQASLHLLHLGSTVCSRKVYSSAGECLRSALAAAAALPGGGFGPSLDLLCLGDVAEVLRRGAGSAALALGEAMELVRGAAEAAEEERREGGGSGKAPVKLRRGEKKIEFLMSFASHHEELLTPLAAHVQKLEEAKRGEARVREEEESCRVHGGMALPPR